MKVCKKPVEIDAFDVAGLILAFEKDWKALPPIVAEIYERGDIIATPSSLRIVSDHGVFTATPSDMLIIGRGRHIRVCRKEVFEETYEVLA